MNEGAALRKSVLEARNRLDPSEITKKSHAIAERLLGLAEMSQAKHIFIYAHFRSEVETLAIIERLLADGKKVAVPLTRVKERHLDVIDLTDPQQELVPGYCGIPEPRAELAVTRLRQPETLDAIILPGSVFDLRGGRFGYGGGYYDRLLERIPAATRIALAFELQVVDRLPLQPHDQLLDVIVTEDRTIIPPQSR